MDLTPQTTTLSTSTYTYNQPLQFGKEQSGPEHKPHDFAGTLVEGGSSVELLHDAKIKLLTGTFDVLMIELCCEVDSALSKATPSRAIALRVTKGNDLAKKETKSMLHALIRCAASMSVVIHVWGAYPVRQDASGEGSMMPGGSQQEIRC